MERNMNVWLPSMRPALPTTGDLACNPGMCREWESNQQPFDPQVSTQPLSHTSQGYMNDFLRSKMYFTYSLKYNCKIYHSHFISTNMFRNKCYSLLLSFA